MSIDTPRSHQAGWFESRIWTSIFLLSFVVSLAIDLLYFPRTTVFADEQRFLESAVRLVATGEYSAGSGRAWEMPGTALLYALFVWLAGEHGAILLIRAVQALIVAGQALLVGAIAKRLFADRFAAIIAASVVAFYPFLLFYQGLLLSETLFTALLTASFYLLYCWLDAGAQISRLLIAVCVVFALATLTKATLTFFPPLLVAAAAYFAGSSIRQSAVILLVALAVFAATMSPWWIRNAAVLGKFVPLTTGSAQNLYLGNNSKNSYGGVSWETDVDREETKKILAVGDEVARQQMFSEAARRYILADPVGFMQRAAVKFVRFWSVVPNTGEYRGGVYSIVSVLSFGPVLLLSVAGAISGRRQWRRLMPIYLLIGYFTCVHIVAIASLRYRLPLEPLLILLACLPMARIARAARQRLFG